MFGATSHIMKEVCGGTSHVMTKVYDSTNRIITEVGGGASCMMPLFYISLWYFGGSSSAVS